MKNKLHLQDIAFDASIQLCDFRQALELALQDPKEELVTQHFGFF